MDLERRVNNPADMETRSICGVETPMSELRTVARARRFPSVDALVEFYEAREAMKDDRAQIARRAKVAELTSRSAPELKGNK